MDLGHLMTGTDGRVTSVNLDHGTRLRMSELGLRPGVRVRVTHRAAFGGRVLAIGTDRFAVDARTCGLIEVAAIDEAAEAHVTGVRG